MTAKLSPTRKLLLDLVREEPSLSPQQLGDRLGVSKQTIIRNLRWLSSKGFGDLMPGSAGRGNFTKFIPVRGSL